MRGRSSRRVPLLRERVDALRDIARGSTYVASSVDARLASEGGAFRAHLNEVFPAVDRRNRTLAAGWKFTMLSLLRMNGRDRAWDAATSGGWWRRSGIAVCCIRL
jgi:hypothetical protein